MTETPALPHDDTHRAVIIGAGVAGLTAAAALAPVMRNITIIEQDFLEGGTAPRRRVPQGCHVHALLDSGRATLEKLFPGFSDLAVAQGALCLPVRSRWRSFDGRKWAAPEDTGPVILSQSRGHLEHVMRQCLARLSNVRVVRGRVRALIGGTGSRLAGVEVEERDGTSQQMRGAWVIDASGRAGQTMQWLGDLGYDPVGETVVNPDVRYASMMLDRTDVDSQTGTSAWLQLAQAPNTRGLILAPIEGSRWIATITDRFGAAVPKDAAEFLRALTQDFDGHYRHIFARGVPQEAVSRFHIGSVRMRAFDTARLPIGFLPVGDAVATYNPLHAQGMSVAALQADALRTAFSTQTSQDPQAIQDRYLAQALAISRNAWHIGQAVDLSYPQFQTDAGPDAQREALMLRAAFAASTARHDMARQIDRTMHMLDPFSALTTPMANAG